MIILKSPAALTVNFYCILVVFLNFSRHQPIKNYTFITNIKINLFILTMPNYLQQLLNIDVKYIIINLISYLGGYFYLDRMTPIMI